MDAGSKLEELNLTSEELARFTEALKDEKFRELLKDYTKEISDPENKKKYEEEITLMEQERGMDIKFIHPKPDRVLKTSLEGKQKCFINICSNELIGKPECRPGKGVDGRVGQHWSLPYSVTPGRPGVNSKGNKYQIYDVVFHSDTLYIAGKNDKFMKLVETTAVQGVQAQCKVKLDEKNVKVLKIKYKGAPNPAVIRKPLPGHAANEKEAEPNDPLRFPYPYHKTRSQSCSTTEGPDWEQNRTGVTRADSDDAANPTEPHYTVKYRSYIDLQDYRCSRDSAPGPRPKEIVVTIDLPLLKSPDKAALNATEKHLVLESQNPSYRLVLALSYPVDEKKGVAIFDKHKRQLTVTLPVLPLKSSPITEIDRPQLVSDTICGETHSTDGDAVAQAGDDGVCGAHGAGVLGQPDRHQLIGSVEASSPAADTQSVDPENNHPAASLANHDGFEPTEVAYEESEGPFSCSVDGEPGRLTDASKPTDPRFKEAAAAADCEENFNEEEETGVQNLFLDNVAGEKSKAESNLGYEAWAGTGSGRAEDLGAEDRSPNREPEPVPGPAPQSPPAEGSRYPPPPEDEVTTDHGVGRVLDGAVGFSPGASGGEDGETEEPSGSVGEAETESAELDEDDLPAAGTPLPAAPREVSGENVRAGPTSDHSTSTAFSFENSLLYELD